MERPYILHMFTPGRQMSPFDINMAADAGYQMVVPYCAVGVDAIAGLTQDTIFSRGPKGVARTGIFIGGRDALLAADMVERSKAAMVKPFVVSLMADPSGAYTTAAAMVACVEAALKRHHAQGLEGRRVVNPRRYRAGRAHRRRDRGAGRRRGAACPAATASTWPSRPRARPASASA